MHTSSTREQHTLRQRSVFPRIDRPLTLAHSSRGRVKTRCHLEPVHSDAVRTVTLGVEHTVECGSTRLSLSPTAVDVNGGGRGGGIVQTRHTEYSASTIFALFSVLSFLLLLSLQTTWASGRGCLVRARSRFPLHSWDTTAERNRRAVCGALAQDQLKICRLHSLLVLLPAATSCSSSGFAACARACGARARRSRARRRAWHCLEWGSRAGRAWQERWQQGAKLTGSREHSKRRRTRQCVAWRTGLGRARSACPGVAVARRRRRRRRSRCELAAAELAAFVGGVDLAIHSRTEPLAICQYDGPRSIAGATDGVVAEPRARV